jgi:hypothetical protein
MFRNLKRFFIVDPFVVNFVPVSIMKRLVPILFLTVYTFTVVVGSTAGRAQAWAAGHNQSSKHDNSQNLVQIGGVHRRAPRQAWQTKMPEDGSVIVSPFVRTTPPHLETVLHHFAIGLVSGQSAEVFSTRAPPADLS